MADYYAPTAHPEAQQLIDRYGTPQQIEGSKEAINNLCLATFASLFLGVITPWLLTVPAVIWFAAAAHHVHPWHMYRWHTLEQAGHIARASITTRADEVLQDLAS